MVGRQTNSNREAPLHQAKCAAFPKYAYIYSIKIQAGAAAVIAHLA